MISSPDFGAIPWFWPAVALVLVVSVVLCRPVGRRLGVAPAAAWLGLASVGSILVTTLTPHRDALMHGAVGAGTCDLSRWVPATFASYLGPNDTGENVLLFVPLGIAAGWLPSRWRTAGIGAAVLLPFVIEFLQRQALILNRSCQSGDLVDNLLGLLIGLAIGVIGSWLTSRFRRGTLRPNGHDSPG